MNGHPSSRWLGIVVYGLLVGVGSDARGDALPPPDQGPGPVRSTDSTRTCHVPHQEEADSLRAVAGHLESHCKKNKNTDLCKTRCAEDSPINLCALADPEHDFARAFYLVDAPRTKKLLEDLQKKVPENEAPELHGAVSEALGNTARHSASPLDFLGVGGWGELATRLLTGLANFIADRAQREALAYVMKQVDTYLCHPANDEMKKEIGGYWLRGLCGVIHEDRLRHGGSGASVVEMIRSAIASDLRALPGRAAGLVVGSIFLAEAKLAPFGCHKDINAKTKKCEAWTSIREASSELIGSLMVGDDVTTSLATWGQALDSANAQDASSYSPATQIVACLADIPAIVARFEPCVDGADPADLGRATRHVLTALVASDVCWKLIGKPETDFGRLTTLSRLQRDLSQPGQAVSAAWAKLVAPRPAPTDPREAAERGVATTLAAIDFIAALTDALTRWYTLELNFKCRTDPTQQTCPITAAEARSKLNTLRSALRTLRPTFVALRNALDGDWGEMILAAVQLVDRLFPRDGSPSVLKGIRDIQQDENKRVNAIFNRVLEYSGVFLSILNAKNADEVTKALEAAAEPLGGGAAKSKQGRVTISLLAHMGLFSGGETRWGTYGARYEDGKKYGVAPTLMMPIGFDVTWGLDSCSFGVFVSLIDPAAFLQYDTKEGLPEPDFTTVIAPGLGLRFGLGDSPFALMAYGVYRPGLRKHESQGATPGADVLQYGLGLTVDVTLWTLLRK